MDYGRVRGSISDRSLFLGSVMSRSAGIFRCGLTVNNQSRQGLSGANRVAVRLDFEYMKGVSPVGVVGLAVFLENEKVGAKPNLVKNPTPKHLRTADMIALRDPGVVDELGLRQNFENPVCDFHQRLVENFLVRAMLVAKLTVLCVIPGEFLVLFHSFDLTSPIFLPVIGDVEDGLHEDLEIDENPATEIFADVGVVFIALVPIDSVHIAFLSHASARSEAAGRKAWHTRSDIEVALWGFGRHRRVYG